MLTTRELNEIRKHYRRFHRESGEAVVWYEFIPLGTAASSSSVYDDVYDEGRPSTGGRRYREPVIVPVLLITESEDQKRAIPEGRQPTQLVNLVASVEDFKTAGLEAPWEYQNHLNDMFQYDGRYFSVMSYRVRGRARDDVMIVVEGIEVYINQEMVNDPSIGGFSVPDLPWPTSLPILG